jgi:hypothetical protein
MNTHTKKILRTSLSCLAALSFLTALAAASARAQSREEHFISARAGGVNFVSGDVRRRSGDEVGWQKLSTKEDLQTGDEVRTGADGLAEVLLNPGSYFRAGQSSQFEMVDASLDNLRLRISRGSAVIEATGYDKLGLNIAVATPQAHARIMRTGVYRFTVLPSGVTEIAVQKGRLVVVQENDQALVVKSGQVARVGAGTVELAKLDKSNRDALDLWSRERGKELAKLNESLAARQSVSNLRRGLGGGLFPASSGGVWAFNSSFGCYTFLPFYYGWSSPYGYGYTSFYVQPAYPSTYPGGSGTTGQGGYHPGGGNTYPTGNGGGGSGTNPYPGNSNPSPPPTYTPPPSPPARDVPSRDIPALPRTKEP